MYRQGHDVTEHHKEKYGEDFNYHQFIPNFTAENFSGEEWAKLFKSTGARFAGPCAVHHDGFSLWDSEVNPWNSVDMGPKRDITGELLSALKSEGLKTITTFHHARNLQRNADKPEEWVSTAKADCGYDSHYGYDPKLITATSEGDLAKFYGNISQEEFLPYWFDQVKEVVDQYSPDMIWFDSWLNLIPEKNIQEMAAYYYNQAATKGQEVTIGYKQHDMPLEVGINDFEQGGKMELSERVWMTDVTLSNYSWSYIDGQSYKSAAMVVRNMIDVWSKNGVVLMNISPKADGTIPAEQRAVMSDIGGWMERNGEAIYGTVPHTTHGFGTAMPSAGTHGGQTATMPYDHNDIRYTVAADGKSMYLFFLGAPEVGSVVKLGQLGPHRYPPKSPIVRATMLDGGAEVPLTSNSNFYTITIPDAPMDPIATVIKLELK